MSEIDIGVCALVGLAALFGLFRGLITQVMVMACLVGAFFAAPHLSVFLTPWIVKGLSLSHFISEKISLLVVGLCLYIVFRLLSIKVEGLLLDPMRELKIINRLGGALLGAFKGAALLALLFCFISLIPKSTLIKKFPSLVASQSYFYASKYNPMGSEDFLSVLRKFRSQSKDPVISKQLKKSKTFHRILQEHEMKDPFEDPRFVKHLDEGDYESLRKNHKMKEFLQDDELAQLLENLEQEPFSQRKGKNVP